jgi:hypothetical protein
MHGAEGRSPGLPAIGPVLNPPKSTYTAAFWARDGNVVKVNAATTPRPRRRTRVGEFFIIVEWVVNRSC